MELWIPITLFAAVMQVVRTGLQKSLLAHINEYAVTWVRFGLALPLVPLYLFVLILAGGKLPTPTTEFFIYVVAAGVMQITATLMLMRLFSRRNFAVCTAFAKTEAAQIAVFGTLLFDLPMSAVGIGGVALGAAGILLMLPRGNIAGSADSGGWTVAAGIACGAGFALTSLFAKQAASSLNGAPLEAAAVTLSIMLAWQTLLLSVLWRRHLKLAQLWQARRRVLLVGVLSFAGSAGWLSAFALTHPAFVKTLAQVELPLAWLLGRAMFSEKPRTAELAGMVACAAAAIVVAFA